jgi:hypothetical protein
MGTAINETILLRITCLPLKSIYTIAYAATREAKVQNSTEPMVMMPEFINQRKNFPPCIASTMLPKSRGQGRFNVLSRYCSWVLSAAVINQKSGYIQRTDARTKNRYLKNLFRFIRAMSGFFLGYSFSDSE